MKKMNNLKITNDIIKVNFEHDKENKSIILKWNEEETPQIEADLYPNFKEPIKWLWFEDIKLMLEWKEGKTIYIFTKYKSEGYATLFYAYDKEELGFYDFIIEPTGYISHVLYNNYTTEQTEDIPFKTYYRYESEYNDKMTNRINEIEQNKKNMEELLKNHYIQIEDLIKVFELLTEENKEKLIKSVNAYSKECFLNLINEKVNFEYEVKIRYYEKAIMILKNQQETTETIESETTSETTSETNDNFLNEEADKLICKDLNDKTAKKPVDKVKCPCGAVIRKDNISTHQKTKKHINLMKQQKTFKK